MPHVEVVSHRVANQGESVPLVFATQVSGHTESRIMANLGQKKGVFHVRFRFQGKEYKKSLQMRDKDAAVAARRLVEVTIHRLLAA